MKKERVLPMADDFEIAIEAQVLATFRRLRIISPGTADTEVACRSCPGLIYFLKPIW